MRILLKIWRFVSGRSNYKVVILIRGVSGSGKTTLANHLARNGRHPVMAADDYFIQKDGTYVWSADKLGQAHKECENRCKKSMQRKKRMILVNNTFTKAKSMKPYFKLADTHGYIVFSIIVENRCNTINTHNVPAETILDMADTLRNNIKLVSDDIEQMRSNINTTRT